jgi:hypothetical protein
MKKYKAINESSWVKLIDVTITEGEALMLNTGTEEQIAALEEDIKLRSTPTNVVGNELADLLAIYNSYKPTLKEGDVYDLISFNVAISAEKRMGAYNYKLNKNIVNVILN